MRLRKSLRFAPFAAILVSSCADLPDIPEDTCGNGIIDANEYCDRFPTEPGTGCRQPGASGECNFDCSGADKCPTGWACGNDSICRPPSGSFTPGPGRVTADSARLTMGDFDGDLRKDVLAIGAAELAVEYFDPSGSHAGSFSVNSANLLPAVGRLSGSAAADDLAFPLLGAGSADLGVAVLLGLQDRTFSAAAYPTLVFPAPANLRFIAQIAETPYPDTSLAPYLLVDLGAGMFGIARAAQASGSAPTFVLALPGASIATLAGDAAHANLDERATSPCEEIAFDFAGDTKATVYTPCYVDKMGAIGWNDPPKANDFNPGDLPIPPTSVKLPPTVTVAPDRGVMLVDANGDGHEDLVIPVRVMSELKDVYVAYNFGDGVFHSSFVPNDPADEVNTASPLGKLSKFPFLARQEYPLALAKLNDDGLPDFVTPSGIFVSSPGAKDGPVPDFDAPIERALGLEPLWTEAVVADFNHDGALDVFAALGSTEPGGMPEPGIDFYAGVPFSSGLGAGGGDAGAKAPSKVFFNHTLLPTSGPAAHLAVGDFDGDLVNDLAINQGGSPVPDGGPTDTLDTPAILFGQPVGAPLPPKAIGQLEHVVQMVPANLSTEMDQDLITDLGIISNGSSNVALSILSGRSDRLILAPFGLLDQMTRAGPIRIAVGQFTSDTHADVASVGLVPDTSIFDFWLAPATDAAKVTTSFRGKAVIPVDFDAKKDDPRFFAAFLSSSQLASGDLDPKKAGAQALDELVFVMPLKDGDGGLRVVIGRVNATDPKGPRFGTPIAADVPKARLIRGVDQGQLKIADVDGDGAAEILLLGEYGESNGVIEVFWNKGDGTFDMSAAPTLIHASDPKDTIAGFDMAQLDLDPELEIAFVTARGTFAVDAKGRAFAVSPKSTTLSGRAIAAGDVNGDGLDDLAISDGQNISLLLENPIAPGDPKLTP